MDWSWVAEMVMVAVLLISIATDIKSRMIYNKVIFPGLAIAIMTQTIIGGASGLLLSVAGLAVGLSLLLLPYLIGGMGAGDVKLLALVGAFKGVKFVLVAGVYMAILGAIMAIGVLLIQRGAMRRLQWTVYYVAGIQQGVKLPLNLKGTYSSIGYPYGVAIGGGALLALLLEWKGGGGFW